MSLLLEPTERTKWDPTVLFIEAASSNGNLINNMKIVKKYPFINR